MNNFIDRFGVWLGLSLMTVAAVIYGVQGVAGIAFWVPMGLALAALGLYFSRNFDAFKAAATDRKTRMGANSALLVLSVVAIAALGQAILNNHDVSWDLSKGKVNTLADETEKAMQNLGKEIQLLAFYDPNGGQQAAYEAMLRKVKKLNPAKFNFEFVNLNKRPLLAQQYSVRSYGTSVLIEGERHETINSAKEEDLVNAILKLSGSGSKTAYVTAGHNEANLADNSPQGASQLKKALENATFVVKELNLATAGAVPADAAAVLIPGPRTDFPPAEAQVLRDYLSKGGRLVVALDPRTSVPNLTRLVAEAGIVAGNDIVVDPILRMFGADPIAPIVSSFDPGHPVTRDLRNGQSQLIFPMAQTISLKDKMPTGASSAVLATSNPTAWAYRGAGNRLPSKPGPSDTKGPVKLAVAVEGPNTVFDAKAASGRNFRIVALGSSRLMSNDGIALYNNQDLSVNSARWLAHDEKRISIGVKHEENQPLMLERGRMALIWWSVVLLPLFTLGLGFMVVLRRKRAA